MLRSAPEEKQHVPCLWKAREAGEPSRHRRIGLFPASMPASVAMRVLLGDRQVLVAPPPNNDQIAFSIADLGVRGTFPTRFLLPA